MGVNDKVRGKTDIGTTGGLIEVGILLYSGVQMSAVLGLTDLFGVANRLSAEHGGTNPRELRISHWQLRNNENLELGRVFDTHQQQPRKLVGLILPPSLDSDPQGGTSPQLQRWVEEQHSSGCIVCSVCGGAFLLAKTGLLNGRYATTHWTFSQTLADRFLRFESTLKN
jgi:transcriptional regulator GlxA family with amidase domain